MPLLLAALASDKARRLAVNAPFAECARSSTPLLRRSPPTGSRCRRARCRSCTRTSAGFAPLEAEYVCSCLPTSAREDHVFRCTYPHSAVLTRCSEDAAQHRPPALRLAYSALRLRKLLPAASAIAQHEAHLQQLLVQLARRSVHPDGAEALEGGMRIPLSLQLALGRTRIARQDTYRSAGHVFHCPPPRMHCTHSSCVPALLRNGLGFGYRGGRVLARVFPRCSEMA